MEVLAARLKWLREKKRYSQKDVAEKIGMTISGMQKIEYNQRDPKLDVLVKFVEVFDESSDFLLGITDYNFDTEISLGELVASERDIDFTQKELTRTKMELDKIKAELKNINRDDSNRIMMESQIDVLTNMIHRTEQRLMDYYAEYDKMLFNHLFNFYSIPGSKPEKDKLIQKELPLNVFIVEYNNKKYYKVLLENRNKELIRTIAIYNSGEKEKNYENAEKTCEHYRSLFRIDQ